jgi:two-component system CheB/CheR fusion protein
LTDFETIIHQENAIIDIGKLPVIQAIPIQMEQLFHNLLSNALKFSGRKKAAQINITSATLNSSQLAEYPNLNSAITHYEIIVKDNGIGFSPRFTEQIFIIFQRLNDDKNEFPGTGIGLALCRKIVSNHGGEIFAVSKEGKGAAFHIILSEKQS